MVSQHHAGMEYLEIPTVPHSRYLRIVCSQKQFSSVKMMPLTSSL